MTECSKLIIFSDNPIIGLYLSLPLRIFQSKFQSLFRTAHKTALSEIFDNFVVRFQSKTHSSTKQSRWFLSCSRKATGNPQVIFTLPAIVRQHGDKWSYQKKLVHEWRRRQENLRRAHFYDYRWGSPIITIDLLNIELLDM